MVVVVDQALAVTIVVLHVGAHRDRSSPTVMSSGADATASTMHCESFAEFAAGTMSNEARASAAAQRADGACSRCNSLSTVFSLTVDLSVATRRIYLLRFPTSRHLPHVPKTGTSEAEMPQLALIDMLKCAFDDVPPARTSTRRAPAFDIRATPRACSNPARIRSWSTNRKGHHV